MRKKTTWLWPDHAISKGESRTLREEHNALANEHAAMLELLQDAVPYVEESEQFNKPSCRGLSKRILAAIARAEGGAA